MRQIVFFLLLSQSIGLVQSQNIDEGIISELDSTATKIGLNDNPYKERYRIWHSYYVLELILESENKYSGSINFYFYWKPKKGTNTITGGIVFRNISLTSDNAYSLHKILIDSMNIDKKIKNMEDTIYLDFSCFSYIEYFKENNFSSIKYCPSSESGKEQDSHKYYTHYIDSIVSIEDEINYLIQKVNAKFSFNFYSHTNCCCGNEYIQ